MTKSVPPNKAETTVYIDKVLKKEFKMACTDCDTNMSNEVEKLIEGWMDDYRKHKRNRDI